MTEARKRVRPRKRTSPAAETPAQSPELHNPEPTTETGGNGRPDEQAGESIEDAKLYLLQILILQGKTQEEIGACFGVSGRTIRNWKKRQANRPSRLLDQIDAKSELTQFVLRFAAREHELLCWMRNAEAENDKKSLLGCNKQLRELQKERYRFLCDIGAFKGVKLTGSDTGEQIHTDLLNQLLGINLGDLGQGAKSDDGED